jgi:thiopurine S-methyltransferase
MDHGFWQERWQRGEIGFHQARVNGLLSRLWPRLALPKESTVFVPLAGKSQDMAWLASEGHSVAGVELSEIAVSDFFKESGLTPERTSDGRFEISAAGRFKLYRGDFFDLTAEDLKDVAAVYDRAALIALPPAIRQRYAGAFARILPPDAVIFLISIEYPEGALSGAPFSVPQSEIEQLYGDAFDLEILERRDGLTHSENLKKRGVTWLEETAYRLKRRT